MRKAIIISLLLHGGLLLWAFGSFMAPAKLKERDAKSVSVEVMSASQFSQLKKGAKEAKPKDKKSTAAPKKKKIVAAPKPKKIVHAKVNKVVAKAAFEATAPKPVQKTVDKQLEIKTENKSVTKVVEPKPVPKPKPAPKVKPAPKPKAKPKPVVKKKAKAKKIPKKKVVKKVKPKPKKVVKKKRVVKKKKRVVKKKAVKKVKVAKKKIQKKKIKRKKTAKRKKTFNPDSIAAILNKIPDAGGSVVPDKPTNKPWKRHASAQNAPAQGRRKGTSNRVTASEIDFFRAQVSRCWSPPVGGLGSGSIIVKLRLAFEENGSLRSMPRLLNRQNSSVFNAAADSAIRAVWQCQPYTMPREKYSGDQGWHDMILNFNPSQMHSGY